MNFVDVLLILLVLFFGYSGWRRGFILSFLGLITWVGSLLLAFFFYRPVTGWLSQVFGLPEIWGRPAAFISIALLSLVLLSLAGHLASRRIPPEIYRRLINRIAGIIPGLFEGLIVAAVLAVFLLILPLPQAALSAVRDSTVVNVFATRVERVEVSLNEIFGEAVTRTLTHLTVALESNEIVYLGFTVTDAVPRPVLEERMLELVNTERRAAGLEALTFDQDLRDVARSHSADMFARGYFGHLTPEGLSPFDRLRRDGVTFLIAGENLSLSPSIQTAHSGLMNSPGHRANILRPQFGRVGFGVLDGGRYGLMVTQMFRN